MVDSRAGSDCYIEYLYDYHNRKCYLDRLSSNYLVFRRGSGCNGIEFFGGVPDSLLASFCSYVTANVAPDGHVIGDNEGGAVALGLGYHLATGKLPLIYL